MDGQTRCRHLGGNGDHGPRGREHQRQRVRQIDQPRHKQLGHAQALPRQQPPGAPPAAIDRFCTSATPCDTVPRSLMQSTICDSRLCERTGDPTQTCMPWACCKGEGIHADAYSTPAKLSTWLWAAVRCFRRPTYVWLDFRVEASARTARHGTWRWPAAQWRERAPSR